jgi:hypothetical protein
MPKGPRRERRPADVIGAAIAVVRISVGDTIENLRSPPGRTRSGAAGGKACAISLTGEQRIAIAKKAASDRWRDK